MQKNFIVPISVLDQFIFNYQMTIVGYPTLILCNLEFYLRRQCKKQFFTFISIKLILNFYELHNFRVNQYDIQKQQHRSQHFIFG